MNNIILKRDYKTYVTAPIPDVVTWEYELSLNVSTDSQMWYLLLEPWTNKEETIFYHRSSGDTVWFYQVNRSNTIAHADNAQVLLVNSIDYMNYILWQTNEQLFLYKKSNQHIVIKWWKFYISSQLITISDLDTELWLANKTLFTNTTNYIYIDTINLDFKITNVVDNNLFLVATVLTNWWWVILNINKEKTLHIWTIWMTWPSWSQWPQWPQWIQWVPWVGWAQIELRINWWYVQWKYDDQVTWNNLILVSDISWTDWIDWREIEIQKNIPLWQIQYRYTWTTTWINMVAFNDIRWPQWSIWATWESQEINDQKVISGTVTIDTINKRITVSKSDWTEVVYSEDWIRNYSESWDLISFESKTWIFSVDHITYSNWDTIDSSWVNETTDWKIAYTNKDNTFTDTNIFEKSVTFKWWVSFPYNTIDMTWTNIINYDWINWENQKCINLITTWAKTLNFSNLYQWRTYWLIINNSSSWNISLVAWSITNWNWITSMKSLWTKISTLSLVHWPHLFFMATADNAIHISYSWFSDTF